VRAFGAEGVEHQVEVPRRARGAMPCVAWVMRLWDQMTKDRSSAVTSAREASLLLGASDDPYAPPAACGLGLIMVLAAITHALLPELR
jgi:hypothetical protein